MSKKKEINLHEGDGEGCEPMPVKKAKVPGLVALCNIETSDGKIFEKGDIITSISDEDLDALLVMNAVEVEK